MDRSSILRASTIYDQGEPFHEGFAFFVAPSWGDTVTSRKEAGAPGQGAASRGRASPAACDSDPHSRAKEREQAGGPPYEQLIDEHL